jgi:hypothetical protein
MLAAFAAHEVFRDVEQLGHEAFLELLLQRRFLSLQFSLVYDIGIDGLTDPDALRLVREILREEYPDASGAAPSHREDLVCDLLALGATRAQVLASRPTAATVSVVSDTLALMLDAAADDGDLRVLTILRFWGEVLVAVEYDELWRRMDAMFLTAAATSRFYDPHRHHDGREPLAGASDASPTHSGRLGAHLARLLERDGDVERFVRDEQQVLALRMRFYDQFVASSAG